MRVYVAGPLFSAAERAFNLDVATRIERLGFEVFLPQRDGAEADRPPYAHMSREQRRAAMSTLDPMISQALDHLCHSIEELEATLAAHLPSTPHAT